MKSLSRVRLFVAPWTAAHQAPQSMEFSRQEHWSGLPFPSPGDLPDPEIEPRSPALQARRDKKTFLRDQCKETEKTTEWQRLEVFKKIRDTRGLFHAKMGLIKDRNGTDLIEAEAIKKRWQEYTEELYKKELHDPDNHNGMITHLEPDILECEVKWALGSITTNKATGGDGIPV